MQRRIILLMILAAFVAGISSLPLRWVGNFVSPHIGKSSIKFGGSLWKGFVSLPYDNGYIDIKTRPLSVFKGQPPIRFETRGAPFMATGSAGWGQLADVRITAPLQALVKRDARLYGLSGNTVMAVSALDFRGDCSASGSVGVDNVVMDYPGWKWKGPKMTGPIACEGGVLTFDLSGQQASDDIRILLGVDRNGGYDLRLSFSTCEPGADLALPLLGFENRSGIWTLVEKGRWQ